MKKLIALVVVLLLAATCFAGCGASTGTQASASSGSAAPSVEAAASTAADAVPSESTAGEKYKIALSNAYMGNDWRQEMIKVTQVVAGKDPYASKVELTIVNVDNTPEAQSASIDDMVQQGYDAILVDASSAAALKPAIQRALDKDIVVVSFDSTVDMDGVYKVETDLVALSSGWANFLVKQLPKGAKIAVDTGLPGSTNGNVVYETAMKIFEDAGLDVVAQFAGEWSDGVGQQQLSSVLAANPDLQGIFSQVYGETIQAAFEQAGRELIPCTAYNTNAGLLAALDNNMPIIIGNNIPGLGAVAMDVAVKVLEGQKVDQATEVIPDMFVNDTSVDVGYPTTKIEENVNCFRDLPGAFDWPVLPGEFGLTVTPEEVSNYKQ